MSAVGLLRQIISDDAVVSLNQPGKSAVLRENDDAFTVLGLPADSIVIKADKFPSPEHFFRGDKGENKRADFIIISESQGRKWIVYIEIKKGSHGLEHEIIRQLKGAECVVAYCRSVAEKFHGEIKFMDERQYKSRFVSIKCVGINKRPTRPTVRKVHDTPERMLKLKYRKRTEFSRLVGNPGS